MRRTFALFAVTSVLLLPGLLAAQQTDRLAALLVSGQIGASDAVIAASPIAGDDGSQPLGLTGIYELKIDLGDGHPLISPAVLFEDPTGRITGGLLLPHRSGNYDVVLIGGGHCPGTHRDVEWHAGEAVFSGFLLEDGAISGEVFSGSELASFEARPFEAPPEGLAGLYDLSVAAGEAPVGNLSLAILHPLGADDRLYAVGHSWDGVGGGVQRRTFLARGRVGGSGLALQDFAGDLRVDLRFAGPVVDGRLDEGPGSRGYDVIGSKRGAAESTETTLASLLETYRLAVEREDDAALRHDLYRGEIPRDNEALLRKLFQYADELSVALVTRELEIAGDRARAVIEQSISFRHSVTGERRQTRLTLRMEFERTGDGWLLRSFERV